MDHLTLTAKWARDRKRTGLFLLVVPPLVLQITDLVLGLNNEALPLWIYLIWVSVPIGGIMYYRGRQLAALGEAARVLGDDRPDVLYLRSFRSDPTILRVVRNWILSGRYRWEASWFTVEEQLQEALRPFGDLVAIGMPGEPLPIPGAARLYAGADGWQAAVYEQMRAASLVILRVDSTAGVRWEFEAATRTVAPERVMLMILRVKRGLYSDFRNYVAQHMQIRLPTFGELKRAGGRDGFIHFTKDWTPHYRPLRSPYFRGGGSAPFAAAAAYALEPVYKTHGHVWPEPPINHLRPWETMGRLLVWLIAIFFAAIVATDADVRSAIVESLTSWLSRASSS